MLWAGQAGAGKSDTGPYPIFLQKIVWESVGWEGSDDKYIIQSQPLRSEGSQAFHSGNKQGRGVNFRYKR